MWFMTQCATNAGVSMMLALHYSSKTPLLPPEFLQQIYIVHQSFKQPCDKTGLGMNFFTGFPITNME